VQSTSRSRRPYQRRSFSSNPTTGALRSREPRLRNHQNVDEGEPSVISAQRERLIIVFSTSSRVALCFSGIVVGRRAEIDSTSGLPPVVCSTKVSEHSLIFRIPLRHHLDSIEWIKCKFSTRIFFREPVPRATVSVGKSFRIDRGVVYRSFDCKLYVPRRKHFLIIGRVLWRSYYLSS
jgi:hypothetical protein